MTATYSRKFVVVLYFNWDSSRDNKGLLISIHVLKVDINSSLPMQANGSRCVHVHAPVNNANTMSQEQY